MLSKSLALALFTAPLALSQGSTLIGSQDGNLAGRDAQIRPGCPNSIAVEPVLILNVSGASLLGPIERHLAVYSNGQATFSSSSAAAGDALGQDLQQAEGLPPATIAIAATVQLGLDETHQLLADLRRAGAHAMCDQETYVTDVPLQTLTLLEPRPDAIAHTFSFWGGVGQYSDVEAVLDNFVEAYFPGL